MAFVVLQEGAAASPELAAELQQFVREQLAEYKRPRWVEFVADLPKTATGKIQRFQLRALAKQYGPMLLGRYAKAERVLRGGDRRNTGIAVERN